MDGWIATYGHVGVGAYEGLGDGVDQLKLKYMLAQYNNNYYYYYSYYYYFYYYCHSYLNTDSEITQFDSSERVDEDVGWLDICTIRLSVQKHTTPHQPHHTTPTTPYHTNHTLPTTPTNHTPPHQPHPTTPHHTT